MIPRHFRALVSLEAFVRVMGQMTSAEMDCLGAEMEVSGLTGREVMARAAVRAGKWSHLVLEPVS